MLNPNRLSRPKIAIGLLALVAGSVAATWIASGQIRSPAEAAARTTAPEPSAILVPAETRVLSSDIVTRGTGRFGSPQALTIVPSNLKVDSGYVDTVPTVGEQLHEGDIAVVISGRPVIILQGAQPMFRDMGPGMSGSDVLQLEQALERLGFPPGDVDGTYDLTTQFAVSAWYQSLDVTPSTASSEQQSNIRAVEADLDSVDRDVLAADEAVAAAAAEVVAAQEAHRVAVAATADAVESVRAARAEATAANNAAAAERVVANATLQRALFQLPPEWASEEEQRAALFHLDDLRLALAVADANIEVVRVAGEAAVRSAELAMNAAPGEVANAAAAVATAQTRMNLARQARDLAGSPTLGLEQDLRVAAERAGVQVPADEVIFVPETPVRIAEVTVRRGDRAEGTLLSVTDAIVAIDGSLALDQVGLVEPGMTVTINESDLGIDATGTVNLVADGPGTQGADGFHVYFETLVTESSTPTSTIAGASVRLTLAVESSGGPVLAVPASAVTLAVDGSSQILVERNGSLEPVTVEPGLAASGYVGITPVSGDLAEGDLVVIGFEQIVTGP